MRAPVTFAAETCWDGAGCAVYTKLLFLDALARDATPMVASVKHTAWRVVARTRRDTGRAVAGVVRWSICEEKSAVTAVVGLSPSEPWSLAVVVLVWFIPNDW